MANSGELTEQACSWEIDEAQRLIGIVVVHEIGTRILHEKIVPGVSGLESNRLGQRFEQFETRNGVVESSILLHGDFCLIASSVAPPIEGKKKPPPA